MADSEPEPNGPQPQTLDHVPSDPSLGQPITLRANSATTPTRPKSGPATASPASPIVEGYEIIGELGRGGMGVVFEARDVRLNRPVALKMIRNVETADRVSIARFWAEAEVMAAVRHANVAQVYELSEHDGVPFLAMELLPGGSLAQHLKSRPPIFPRDAAELLANIARGVAAAHEQGIVHRDLKPANVLRASGVASAPGEHPRGADATPLASIAKVTDFGLAKRASGNDLTRTQAVMGTPAYMAPEQAAGGAKFVGPQADVWALGVILYECITGGRPFEGDDTLSVLNAVQNRTPVRPSVRNRGVPRDLELICLKCLEKSPTDRYPSAKELADDLERFVAGKPVTARPVGAVTQAVKWVKRNPIPAGLIAAVLIGSCATATAALVALRNAREATAAETRRVEAEREATTAANKQLLAEREQTIEKDKRDRAEREAAVAAALQANDLGRVVEVVKAAERDGLAVPPELRLAAAAALDSLGQPEESRERLAALVALSGLEPTFRARVELRYADALLGVDDERAMMHLRAARESGKLDAADRAYADAIEATSMPEAINHLQDAIRHDPAHFPARRMLGTYLLLSGRLDEAIRASEAGLVLARNHPDILWTLVFAHGFKGDVEESRKAFERVRPFIRPELTRQMELVAKFFPVLNTEFRISFGGTEGKSMLEDLLREFLAAGGTRALTEPLRLLTDGTGSLLTRMSPAFRDALSDYIELGEVTARGRDYVDELVHDEVRLARLARNLERRPEGFMQHVLAQCLLFKAQEYDARYRRQPGHAGRARDLYRMAGDAYARAADTPALTENRFLSLEGAALCYAMAGKFWWGPTDVDQESLRKAAEMVRRRLERPEPIVTYQLDLLIRVCRRTGDLTTARRLLDEWERRDPESPTGFIRRADVEFDAQSYYLALTAARRAIAVRTRYDLISGCVPWPARVWVVSGFSRQSPIPTDADRMRQIESDCLARFGLDPDRLAPAPRLKR